MTKAKMKQAIMTAWYKFARQAEQHREFAEALAETERGERAHRAMGRRFTKGQCGYNLSVDVTTRYFVLKNTFEPKPVPCDWIEIAGWRKDIVLCQALRARLVNEGRFDAAFGTDEQPAFMAIDYAEDIAA